MSTNTIIRAAKNKENPYTLITRSLFEDDRLSWRAKGLMGYLLSRKDDWKVFVGDLQKRSRDGRDACYAALDELGSTGYLERHEIRLKGRIQGYEYVIHEQPCPDRAANWKTASGKTVSGKAVSGKTESGKTGNGCAVSGKSDTSNKELQVSTDEESTDEETLSLAAHAAEGAPSQGQEVQAQPKTTEGGDHTPAQVQGPANAQPGNAADTEEVPPAAPRVRPSNFQRLVNTWNEHRGTLPAVEQINEGRKKAMQRLLRDCDQDVEKAVALLADATREVASDEHYQKHRFGFDTVVPSKVFGRAEAWRSRNPGTPDRTDAPPRTEPRTREEWLS